MPDFGRMLSARVATSLQLPATFEQLRLHALPGTIEHRLLHPRRIESAYEMAFLRVFIAWEDVLEQSFIRYLSGYQNAIGGYAPAAGIAFSGSVAAAEIQLYGAKDYLLWHNPNHVIARSRRFFNLGLHEQVCQSNLARLIAFAAVRHRIAHGQADARVKFDNATMLLVGKRYHGGRPGSFLRELEPSTMHPAPPRRWIEAISSEFVALINQIVP